MSVTYVVAVSGGVDSVVLLHMLIARVFPNSKFQIPNSNLIVAHFDHGIRQESAEDAVFVRELAEKYGLPFEMKREELGSGASEEQARDRRYIFLREVAKKHNAKIMTAHHLDDLVETIVINLTRGTGWRGLAVLDSPDIERPLLDMTKAEIIAYAEQEKLTWREDATNQDTKYLRNDIRQRLHMIDDETKVAVKLYRDRQVFLRKEIDTGTDRFVGASPYSRYVFIMTPPSVAVELLRTVIVKSCEYSATRPQLYRALIAIKTLRAGGSHDVAAGILLRCTRTHFIVERSV